MLAIGSLLLAAGCAPRTQPEGSAASPTHGDSKTITEAELAVATQINLYHYISAERRRWFQPGTVVYMNDGLFGAIETLKSVGFENVRLVRYYEASAAQQKFTRRDVGPVIQIITR